jgi:hypothetical protein
VIGDAGDPRMVEARQQARLDLEARDVGRVGHALEGHGSAGLHVASAVDRPHAAAPDLRLDLVATDALTR